MRRMGAFALALLASTSLADAETKHNHRDHKMNQPLAPGKAGGYFSARVWTVGHKSQPYDTVGNWRYHGGNVDVTVSRMSDERYEFLVAMHELIEAYLCKRAGITAETV